MGTAFPGALDSFNNPGPNTSPSAPGFEHNEQHSNANDAIEALEAKVGTTAQANARVHVSAVQPEGAGPYLWVQTGLGAGDDMTFWVEDGL